MFFVAKNWGNGRAYAKLLADADIAIGFFNFDDKPARIPVYADSLGIPDSAGLDLAIRNAITGEDLGVVREYLDPEVPAHDCLVLRATPVTRA